MYAIAVGMESLPSIRRMLETLSSLFQYDTFVNAQPTSRAMTADFVQSIVVLGIYKASERMGGEGMEAQQLCGTSRSITEIITQLKCSLQ